MSRLIDVDVLMEVLEKIPAVGFKNIDNQTYTLVLLAQVFNIIKQQPTIERKTGRWIDMWDKNDPYTSSRGRCSICGRESDRPLGDYCKWCGADMMSLPEPYKEGTDNQITACPMCPDCPDNCPLGEDMRGDDHEDD